MIKSTAMGICGWKDSGKTTLIEQLVPLFLEEGLSVAVVKHDTHGIDIDHPGKDSDRFFRAGADVVLQGPDENVLRRRIRAEALEPDDLDSTLAALAAYYDLILVEGHKGTALPKIWLHRQGEGHPPDSVTHVLMEVPFETGRAARVFAFIKQWLGEQYSKQPLYGCVLIGGQSRRMGAPKHLIAEKGETWLERTVGVLLPLVSDVIVSGAGRLPSSLAAITRLADIPVVQGPVAGILAAMRWNPAASWIVAACDMPRITTQAVEWLLEQRRPGIWAVMPALGNGAGRIEPLLAWYDFRSQALFEAVSRSGKYAVLRIAKDPRVLTPRPPEELAFAWKNVNIPGRNDRQ